MTIFQDDVPPTYTTIKVNGKKRKVRRFGAIISTDSSGKQRVIREAEYLFIKDEPNTRYILQFDSLHPNDKQNPRGKKI